MDLKLTFNECRQIATILTRRANEIASYKGELQRTKDLASVDYALELEVTRLRRLADKISPPEDIEQ